MKVKGVTMNMLQNALSRIDNGNVIQVKICLHECYMFCFNLHPHVFTAFKFIKCFNLNHIFLVNV